MGIQVVQHQPALSSLLSYTLQTEDDNLVLRHMVGLDSRLCLRNVQGLWLNSTTCRGTIRI